LGEFFIFLILSVIIYVLYKEFMKEGGFSGLFCELGFHSFDTWKYIDAKTCEKRRACSACGKILPQSEVKIEHSWTMSYLRDRSCEKQETCSHCGLRRGEVVIEHTWLETFVGENSNKKCRECKRCFYREAVQISQPQWPWVFEDGDPRKRFLSLQYAIQQVALSDDMFSISNNSRDKPVKIIEAHLPDTNVRVRGLNIGKMDFMFYPDGIHAIDNKSPISIMLYPELTFDISRIRVENSRVPRDGEVVTRTWLHSKKDGGPDLRYSYNPTTSIIAYALFVFRTSKDGTYQIAISNYANAQKFYTELDGYLNSYLRRQGKSEYRSQNANAYNHQQSYRNSSQSRESNSSRNDSPSDHSDKLTFESARKILAVKTGASPEEIRKAYLELVQKYHPDKVFSLADEYKVIAESKMKKINAAYALLKQNA
jgi:DnaJ-domain-containing protein 1